MHWICELLPRFVRDCGAQFSNWDGVMKKNSILWTLLAFLFLTNSAQAALIVRATPSGTSFSVGNNFTVAIEVSGLTDSTAPSLGVYDINLSFDSALVSLDAIAFGSGLDVLALGSIQSTTLGAGTVNLFELSLDSVSDLNDLQLDTFVLATLNFSSVGVGGNAFDLFINAFGDAEGNSLAAGVVGGSVEITDGGTPPSVPEPASLALVVAGVGAAAIAKRRRRLFAAA